MKKMKYTYKGEIIDCKVELLELDDGSVLLKIVALDDFFSVERSGDNYFQILQELRVELEIKGIGLLCNGTSLNVYPSSMQLSMGGGDRAYRLKMGAHTKMTDIVETFEYDEKLFQSCTIDQQIEFNERWILSKKKLEVSKPEISVDKIADGSEFIFFWGHRKSKDGEMNKSCLSQWWHCNFEKDGIKYSSAEQWMMAEKARVFSDFVVLEAILKTNDPKHAKSLGRKVTFFDEEEWKRRRYDIVKEGNYLKFSQNSDLMNYLLTTDGKIIVEASPYDRVWGIGMKQDERGIENVSNWKGLNLLGFALMEVREALKKENLG